MAERLIVKNFGPLKDIDIELKDVNVFIGPTSSGKSTLAKLVAIFKDVDFYYLIDILRFDKYLTRYNLPFVIGKKTYFYLNDEKGTIEYKQGFKSFFNRENVIEKKIHQEAVDISKKIRSGNIGKMSLDLALQQLSLLLHQLIFLNDINKNTYSDLVKKNISDIDRDINKLTNAEDFNFQDYNLLITNIIDFIKSNIDLFPAKKSIYIPAERTFVSMVANSLFNLLNSNVSLSRSFKDFGANFEEARNELKELDIDLLNAKFKFEENINKVYLAEGEVLELQQASSGMQALIPMMLVVKFFANRNDSIDNFFIIEEPELNLYPTMQKALVEFLIEECTKNGNKLIITTHSPYILTALDNLIQAANVVAEKPHLKQEVTKLVPEERWLDFNRVSAYYVADGTARSILDHEMKSIGANNIDDVSEKLGATFDELLNLRFQES